MPRFFEIYGKTMNQVRSLAKRSKLTDRCPFSEAGCDGGGNRHQTKLRPDQLKLTNDCFANNPEKIIPGVCAIDYGSEQWIVCPRRLFGFISTDAAPIKMSLQTHERDALSAMGAPSNVSLGIWTEVYLKFSSKDDEDGDVDAVINYHFDYLIAPVTENVPINKATKDIEANDAEIKKIESDLNKAWKINKKKSEQTLVPYFPDISHPLILEVMTASTSGSNRSKGTDIASAFCSSICDEKYMSPGINKRQVWGRMATQLFAKSALAEAWDGKTYWLIQDRFLSNIEMTTKLSLANMNKAQRGNVHFCLFNYGKAMANESVLEFQDIKIAKSGLPPEGSNACVDILLPRVYPPKSELLKALLRNRPAAIVKI